MKNVLFSIIMPVYNTKREFLSCAIDSVLNQNFKNFELIIVNDGSNKETYDFLDTLNNPIIKVLNQENTGISKARLNGLQFASGSHVMFFDSDDYLCPNSLALINKIITEYEPDIVLYDFARFHDDYSASFNKQHFFNEGSLSKKDVLTQLCQLHINSICSKIVKRELLDNIENNIDIKIVNGEDLQQSAFLINKANSFYYTESNIQLYRVPTEKRNYYKLETIPRDINFVVAPHNILFLNGRNVEYLRDYKLACTNSIIFNIFRLFIFSDDKKKTIDIYNQTLSSKAFNTIDSINCKLPIANDILFKIIKSKSYFIIKFVANIYNRIFKIQSF